QRAVVADFHEAACRHLRPVQPERDLVVAIVAPRHTKGQMVENPLVETVHHRQTVRCRQIHAPLPLDGGKVSLNTSLDRLQRHDASFPSSSCCNAAYCSVKPLSSAPLRLALHGNSAIPAARRGNERMPASVAGQPSLIEINGLTKRFGSFTAVNHV